MPRVYKRKSEKARWTAEQLSAAINAINSGRSVREVARSFNIPRSTLQVRLKRNDTTNASLGRNSVFTKEEEEVLAKQVIKLSKHFYGITPTEIKKCAYKYAEEKKLRHPFSKEKETAGRDWLTGFLKRNPTIRLRKPEATSINRISAFNKTEVDLFFSNLQSLLDKYKFSASKIYNADETGITTVQNSGKILAEKGQKRIGFITSAERGQTTTIMCCISASGTYIPPLFIYARKRMKPELKKNGPPSAVYCCSDNGWINEVIFLEWLKHFYDVAKPSKEDPVLLIVDNHSSHCTLEAYNFCKERGIVVLTIPPHTSHRLQPLDVAFYSSLKSAYNTECGNYLRSHPHERITTSEIAEIFQNAYGRVATPVKAINGFANTGIFPCKPENFTDEDFAPSESFIQEKFEEKPNQEKEVTKLDKEKNNEDKENREHTTPDKKHNLSFVDIIPLPGCSKEDFVRNKRSNHNNSKKQHSEILTSTPMKSILEEKQRKKEEQIRLKLEKGTKRKIGIDESIPLKSSPTPRIVPKRKCLKIQKSTEDTSSEDDDDRDSDVNEDICAICGEFGKNKELWIQCSMCSLWAHKDCTSFEGKMYYICDFCN